MLHLPGNLGIELRPIAPQTRPAAQFLAVFAHGLADAGLVRELVIAPLEQGVPPGHLPAPVIRRETALPAVIQGVLEGATALLADGADEAILIQTRPPAARPAGSTVTENPPVEAFGPDLLDNIALIRKRLRDPALVAEPHDLPEGRAAGAALLYMAGRADAGIRDDVGRWLAQQATEDGLRRGMAAGPAGAPGLLPRLMSSSWPDQAAALLESGYVVALVDRMPYAYLAPVTAPALLSGPGDWLLRRPVARLLRYLRLALCLLILLGPATIVALMNYHQEMIPTPFLLGLASVRESAAFPILAEVLGLELLQEVIRATTARLPVPVSPGLALLGGILLAGLLTFGGMVAPITAMISSITAAASLGLPGRELAYMVRAWRWPFILGAASFGLFGLAAIGFGLAVYLTQNESFAVPYPQGRRSV